MFTIKYKISNEIIDDISGLDAKGFDREYGDLEGQFELNFNGDRQGFVHDDIPFGNELLFSWFKFLNQVALKLSDNDYVAFYVLETDDSWK